MSVHPKLVKNCFPLHYEMHCNKSIFAVANEEYQSEKQYLMQYYLQPEATSPTRKEFMFPRNSPGLIKLMQTTAQAATDKLRLAEKANKSKYERLQELLTFLLGIVGSTEQRLLFAASSGLSFFATIAESFYDHYQQSVLVTTIAAMSSAAVKMVTAGRFGNGNAPGSSVGSSSKLRQIIYIMVLLKTVHRVLDTFGDRLRTAGTAKPPTSLHERNVRARTLLLSQKHPFLFQLLLTS